MADTEQEIDDDEEYVLSTEEKLKIAGSIIKNVPAGQGSAVLKDLQVLFDNLEDEDKNAFNEEFIRSALRERAIERREFIAKSRVICHELSQTGENQYQDPSTGKTHTVDHKTQEITASEEPEGHDDSPLREALDSALQEYCQAHYLDEQYASNSCNVYVTDGGDHVCVISAANTSLNNFWTGNWVSEYTLSGDTVTGNIKLQCHYYEKGNVQLNSDTSCNETIAAGDEKATAKAVVAVIKKFENEFQTKLKNYFATSGEAFKKVRRGLTIHATKFDWRVSVHENVGQMQG